jgi:hypothetical protein
MPPRKTTARKSTARKATARRSTSRKTTNRAPARTTRASKAKSLKTHPLHNPNPWSTRKPQSIILTITVVVILAGVIAAALDYISAARGGVVPVLMLAVAPILAIYYIWYFNFNKAR